MYYSIIFIKQFTYIWKFPFTQKYFTDGEKLADETLLEVVNDAGLNKENFLNYVTTPDNLEKVVTKAASWSAKGISG